MFVAFVILLGFLISPLVGTIMLSVVIGLWLLAWIFYYIFGNILLIVNRRKGIKETAEDWADRQW